MHHLFLPPPSLSICLGFWQVLAQLQAGEQLHLVL